MLLSQALWKLTDVGLLTTLALRPLEGAASNEKVRREDNEILRQLKSAQVETTTTPKGLIHMMTVSRATCIVLLDDDLPPDDSDHTGPLYISVGCSSHLIHKAGAIPSSLHQKIKFIHDGKVIMTLEIEDFCRNFMAMSFDQHSSIVVLYMMRGMSFFPNIGLEQRQHEPSEFIVVIDHDLPFGLRISLADYFLRAPELQTHSKGGLLVDSVLFKKLSFSISSISYN
ncbi:hypothetical protein CK203_043966 [Vitis vinifera]|uniref:Uncharacterized protein n=1 Tax=Vitis vinifera TaxID=29760 RepID=A0A438HTC4_VITVI|nr:hypothetical protein CK203_043966 [Vitis vinifera]